MRFGLSIPHFGAYADPRLLVSIARDAEMAGWDGVFLWDHILMDVASSPPQTDTWVALAAIASSTERIKLGPMVTPLPRRRPWKVARESVALDHLSAGRLILGVGIGEPGDAEFAQFGEDADAKIRGDKLDESLDVVAGLWTGRPFEYAGRHYRVGRTTFLPTPVQRPRIPVWVAGQLMRARPLRRAAKWDGYFPIADGGTHTPTLAEVRAFVAELRSMRGSLEGFDVVLAGDTDPTSGRDALAPYLREGVTWWLEAISGWRGPLDAMRERVRGGPPR